MRIPWIGDLATRSMSFFETMAGPRNHSSAQVPGIQEDTVTRRVRVNGHTALLSPVELRLFQCIRENQGRPVSPEAIIARVWGKQKRVGPSCLKFYIWRLRRKLEADSSPHQLIKSVRGVGYRLAIEELASDGSWPRQEPRGGFGVNLAPVPASLPSHSSPA